MRAVSRRAGFTLIEMMMVLGMLGLFMVLSYQPLLQLMSYVPWSQKVSRDRSSLVITERTLMDGLRKSVDGYLWVNSLPQSTSVLMGQRLHYRGPDEPAVTAYALYHYDKTKETLLRWQLEPGTVVNITGALSATSVVPDAAWPRLVDIKENRSLVATHIIGFRFDPGAANAPITMEIEATSFPEPESDKTKSRPVQRISRELSKVNDEP